MLWENEVGKMVGEIERAAQMKPINSSEDGGDGW